MPTLMMSSVADLHVAKEAVNHGASYILEKPFEVDELILALENIWENPKGLHALLERYLDIQQIDP